MITPPPNSPLDPLEIVDYPSPVIGVDSWIRAAHLSEINDPAAAALATCSPAGVPSVRMVLIRAHDNARFVFYTNNTSRKGQELTHPKAHAALLFHFKSLRKQLRIEGSVTPATQAESDTYFSSRPRLNQLSAWASKQSTVMEDGPQMLPNALEAAQQRFGDDPVPRPPHWHGFALQATMIEFWSERPGRTHHRLIFDRPKHNLPWNSPYWLWP